MPGTSGFIRKFTGPGAWSSVPVASSSNRPSGACVSASRMRNGPLPWPSESIASLKRQVPGGKVARSRSRTSRARAPLVAMQLPPKEVCRPVQSVKTPPASSMMGCSAAASQADSTSSTMTSARPVATSR